MNMLAQAAAAALGQSEGGRNAPKKAADAALALLRVRVRVRVYTRGFNDQYGSTGRQMSSIACRG